MYTLVCIHESFCSCTSSYLVALALMSVRFFIYIQSTTVMIERTLAIPITNHSSVLYMEMAKVLPIIDVLGYDG